MNQGFSIKEAYKYAWNTFKKNWKFLVPFFLIIIVVQSTFSYLTSEKTAIIVATQVGDAVTVPSFICTPSIAVSTSVSCTSIGRYSFDSATVSVSNKDGKIGGGLVDINAGTPSPVVITDEISAGTNNVRSAVSTTVRPFGMSSLVSGILSLISMMLSFFLMAGVVRTLLNIHDNNTVALKNVIGTPKDTWSYLKGSLFWSFVVFIAALPLFITLFFFIIPLLAANPANAPMTFPVVFGIVYFLILFVVVVYFSVRFIFWTFLILDKKLKTLTAFRESNRITKNNFWKLVLFIISGIALNILGVLAFMLGLLITIPVYMLGLMYVYKKLDGQNIESQSTKSNNSEEEKHTEVVVQPKELEAHTA